MVEMPRDSLYKSMHKKGKSTQNGQTLVSNNNESLNPALQNRSSFNSAGEKGGQI
jgi:hypothetical protein